MRFLFLVLCILSCNVYANQAETNRLNALIEKALVEKDYEKARWLAVTTQQKKYVEDSISQKKSRQAAAIGESAEYNAVWRKYHCSYVSEPIWGVVVIPATTPTQSARYENRVTGYQTVERCY